MNGIKLNLYLHVLGREETSGYHRLAHVCVPFTGPDLVQVEPAGADSLLVQGAFAPLLVGENLCAKALAFYRGLTGSTQNYAITLTKNTPVGAGLGAGSFNAAQVLQFVSLLEGVALPPAQSFLPLGAELPFCLYGKPALVEGRGAVLTPVRVPDLYPVLVWPAQGLNTGDVFRQFAQNPHYTEAGSTSQHNDLTQAAITLCPAIADALKLLSQTGEPLAVRMTGSGSTCFALYKTAEEAVVAAATLKKTAPQNWWVYRPL